MPCSEILTELGAVAVMEKAYRKLRACPWPNQYPESHDKDGNLKYGCWDEVNWREARDVRYEVKQRNFRPKGARRTLRPIVGHLRRKASELQVGNPDRNWKVRVAFQGNIILNQNFEIAMCTQMPSQLATLEALAATTISDVCQEAYVNKPMQNMPPTKVS